MNMKDLQVNGISYFVYVNDGYIKVSRLEKIDNFLFCFRLINFYIFLYEVSEKEFIPASLMCNDALLWNLFSLNTTTKIVPKYWKHFN